MINLREAPYSLTQKETCFVLWLFQFNRPVRNANLTRVVSLLRYSSFSSILIQGTTNSFCALLLSISQTGRQTDTPSSTLKNAEPHSRKVRQKGFECDVCFGLCNYAQHCIRREFSTHQNSFPRSSLPVEYRAEKKLQ